MKNVPIIILTKDNPEYLYVTLKSLNKSETFNNPVIIIDNCSELQKTKEFYSTWNFFDTTFDDWTRKDQKSTQEIADKIIGNTFLNIPKINIIQGIKRKFTIAKTPKYLGKNYALLYCINFAFQMFPTAQKCCILDDNILFNKNWLKEGLYIYDKECHKENVGLVSVYNENAKKSEFYEYIKNDSLKGKMVLVSKKLYEFLKIDGFYATQPFQGDGTPIELLQEMAYRYGMTSFSSIQSYIQNLEKRNLVNKEKILKYDLNFRKPIVWDKDF